MPQIKGHAKIFRDWDGLIGACNQNPELLSGVEPLRADLDTLLAKAKEIKVTQDHLKGLREAATQNLDQVFDEGREAARKVRSFIKTRMHSRNAQLSQFGITPNGKRHRKATPDESPTPEKPKPNAPSGPVAQPPSAPGIAKQDVSPGDQ